MKDRKEGKKDTVLVLKMWEERREGYPLPFPGTSCHSRALDSDRRSEEEEEAEEEG